MKLPVMTLATIAVVVFTAAGRCAAVSIDEAALLAPQLARQVASAVQNLGSAVDQTADSLAAAGMAASAARGLLDDFCRRHPECASVAAISAAGRIEVLAPAALAEYAGADISAQPHVREFLAHPALVLSPVFRTVQGYDACALMQPALRDDVLLGAASATFKPEAIIGPAIAPLMVGRPEKAWVMEAGGRILYDADPGEIGRNLFTDELYQPYAALLALGRRMQQEPAGHATYEFLATGATTPVTKEAWWDTLAWPGTSWIVVVIREALPTAAGE